MDLPSTNCALCKKQAILRNSHIFPEFLYRSLYDSKHRLHQISVHPDEKNAFLQKGLREYLLCERCEQLLSVDERYASMMLNGGIGIDIQQRKDRLYLSGLDYKKLKLFQLSILWRAGVAKSPHFSQVNLGIHEEQLRLMLLNKDPGLSSRYGCLMFALMHEKELMQDLIVQPTWARLESQLAYRFIFGGLLFIYVVASHSPPKFIAEHFLQESGTATMKLQQIKELHFLIDSFTKMNRLGKFDIRP